MPINTLKTAQHQVATGCAYAEIKGLLTPDSLPALGPAVRSEALTEAALTANLTHLFASTNLTPARQDLVRGLLLLWHDHLDAAHAIAQNSNTADGSYLHAIVHRREPDYWNAKYWWQRVGSHAAFPDLVARVGDLMQDRREPALLSLLLKDGKWNASTFVDLCEQAAAGTQPTELLREIQRAEFEVLLAHLLTNDGTR